MLVVFLFLRRATPTIAAGVTVPLSLAGTCALMWCVGFSIDNLSLMALAVSVGFVVDDAIVMIENVFRNMEKGHSPLRATIEGARQIGFTVISISVSLVAAFIPLLFMGGIVGRAFREFSVTLVFAIVVSTIVSLTVTPMICAHYIRSVPSRDRDALRPHGRMGAVAADARPMGRACSVLLEHRVLMLVVMVATIALTVDLYIKTPKGFFPQDDTGLIFTSTRASPDISYPRDGRDADCSALDIILADPAVAGVGSSVGGSAWSASVNQGRMFVSLKPLAERDGIPTQRVIDRLRPKFQRIPGIEVWMFPAQDVRVGGRWGRSQYQFTLWSSDLDELLKWVPRAVDRVKTGAGHGRCLDRPRAGRLPAQRVDRPRRPPRATACACRTSMRRSPMPMRSGRSRRSIPSATSTASILEVDPALSARPERSGAYLCRRARGGTQVPLSNVAKFERTIAPLVVNHQGQFPAVTISFGLREGVTLDVASESIRQAILDMRLPDVIQAEFAGDAKAFAASAGAQPLLILAALVAVYLVLGVLYESLAHPLTIISTLPSAGLGALLALQALQHGAHHHRVHRHHPADRHREEERHHAGRLRARSRAPARAFARARDLRGLHGALPPDPDDDACGVARRGAVRDRERGRAPRCAARSA